MSWLTDVARPAIRALAAYSHADWEPGFVRLHANELPWRGDSDRSIAGLNVYPEPHPHELMHRLADFYRVPRGMLLAGRGSDEGIDLLIRSYCEAGRDAVLIAPPTFGMYGVAARIQGANVIEVPLRREDNYEPDFARLRAALTPATRLVFLCSPNNPTGNLWPRAEMLALTRELEGRALVVVDEAYIEFADQPSLAADVPGTPGLVVLRTLSKAHGLAGARCGSLIAHPEIVSLLQKVIQPYAITQLTIEAVFEALQPVNAAQSAQRVASIRQQRTELAAALAAKSAITQVWPSQANFLLVECRDPAATLRATHAAGLLVRDFSRTAGLQNALRITVGTPDQNDRLIASLP
jgi:histidinol-phosphate aminotransferase